MGTTSLTREQLNEAIEQFADKIMEALDVTVTDEEATESELSGTRFMVINLDGRECVVDAELIGSGTLIMDGPFEFFRCGTGFDSKPWMRYNGRQFTHEEFAQEMRDADTLPRIVHQG